MGKPSRLPYRISRLPGVLSRILRHKYKENKKNEGMGLTWGIAAENGNSLRKLPGADGCRCEGGRGGVERGSACSGSWLIFARDKLAATTERPVRGVDMGGSKGCGAVDWRCFASSKRPPSRVSGLQRDKWADPGRDGETATGARGEQSGAQSGLDDPDKPPSPRGVLESARLPGSPLGIHLPKSTSPDVASHAETRVRPELNHSLQAAEVARMRMGASSLEAWFAVARGASQTVAATMACPTHRLHSKGMNCSRIAVACLPVSLISLARVGKKRTLHTTYLL